MNQELLALFNLGKEGARSGDDCDAIDNIHEKIGTLMMLPFIQGTSATFITPRTRRKRRRRVSWAFATAILPFVDAVNPAAAEALYKRDGFSTSLARTKPTTVSQFGVEPVSDHL